MISHRLSVLPGFTRSLSGTSETLPSETVGNYLLSTGQYSQSGRRTLRERQVEFADHQESAIGLVQRDANDTGSIQWYPEAPCEERDDIYWWIANGATDKIEELIDRGYNLNEVSDRDEPPLFYALNFGSLETVLLLLKRGADPNLFRVRPSFTSASSGDYSLRETDKLSRLVLLLSYGANLSDDHNAFGDVLEVNRIFRLAVYYFWEKYCEEHTDSIHRPESVAELNQLVFALPVLQISAYVSLFNDHPEMLHLPRVSLPANIRAFFQYIGA
ncbi:ankyrin repeat domain-containing protein [Endozoicomonas sp. ONNA2]|uniref:ankyrin repeat domain-containing protein n=1 Tax=Endozoicomonas sp. ONNA2 TaxID=2828741 RepID=UPI0021475EE7|nr:ankyrin repeat domain-containing protein [Endozoicomonas sp. ONNA2]